MRSSRSPTPIFGIILATPSPAITNYENHPTIAQKLVFDLLLFNEPPSLRRALRERILAAQITAQFGRTQILEWYLNSAHFGRYAFGADAAAQLYFGKSATGLSPAESAILAAVSDSPSLNPFDAPADRAPTRPRDHRIDAGSKAAFRRSNRERARRIPGFPELRLPLRVSLKFASAFTNLLLSQLDSQSPACPDRARRTDDHLHARL